jgi:hypothetical protein
LRLDGRDDLQAEVRGADLVVAELLGGAAGRGDAAVLDDVAAVGDAEAVDDVPLAYAALAYAALPRRRAGRRRGTRANTSSGDPGTRKSRR